MPRRRSIRPSDLAGMKIRVQNSIMSMKMVQAMGGSPTPVPWGELYTALDQGVVDGAENNSPSFRTSRHYEVCPYYSLDEHTCLPDILVISTRVWSHLSPEQQRILQEAVDESVQYQRKIWAEAELKDLETVQQQGARIVRPDKAPFRESVRSVWKEFEGTEIGELIRADPGGAMKFLIVSQEGPGSVAGGAGHRRDGGPGPGCALAGLHPADPERPQHVDGRAGDVHADLGGSLLGAAVAMGRGAHLGIDYFVGKLPPRARLATEVLVFFFVAAFSLLVMVLGGIDLVASNLELGQESPALRMNMGYVYLAVPISGFFLTLYATIGLVERLKSLKPS